MGAFGGCHINDTVLSCFLMRQGGWTVQLCLLCRKAYYGHTHFELMMCWGGQFICPSAIAGKKTWLTKVSKILS